MARPPTLRIVIVSAIAGRVGFFAGLGATKLAIPFLTESQNVAIPLDPLPAAISVSLALVLGMAASIYPALAAAKMDPNEALRAL